VDSLKGGEAEAVAMSCNFSRFISGFSLLLQCFVIYMRHRGVIHKPILNEDALQRILKGRTDLLEKLITELRVDNGQILSELALEGLLLPHGSSLHDCSYSSVAPVLFRSLLIILPGRIIRGLGYLLLKVANWN
jgi:hypothetical protein